MPLYLQLEPCGVSFHCIELSSTRNFSFSPLCSNPWLVLALQMLPRTLSRLSPPFYTSYVGTPLSTHKLDERNYDNRLLIVNSGRTNKNMLTTWPRKQELCLPMSAHGGTTLTPSCTSSSPLFIHPRSKSFVPTSLVSPFGSKPRFDKPMTLDVFTEFSKIAWVPLHLRSLMVLSLLMWRRYRGALHDINELLPCRGNCTVVGYGLPPEHSANRGQILALIVSS